LLCRKMCGRFSTKSERPAKEKQDITKEIIQMPKETKDPLFDPEDLYAFNAKDDIEELMESISIGGFDRFADSSYETYDSDNYGFDDYNY